MKRIHKDYLTGFEKILDSTKSTNLPPADVVDYVFRLRAEGDADRTDVRTWAAHNREVGVPDLLLSNAITSFAASISNYFQPTAGFQFTWYSAFAHSFSNAVIQGKIPGDVGSGISDSDLQQMRSLVQQARTLLPQNFQAVSDIHAQLVGLLPVSDQNQNQSQSLAGPQLWISFGALVLLIIFQIVAFFTKGHLTAGQHAILRFLSALCAGFAAGFFTGTALFTYSHQLASGAKIAISGAAGCALFFTVWFTFPDHTPPPAPEPVKPRSGANYSIPEGWTFEQAVRKIVSPMTGIVNFDGFSKAQLAVKLPQTDINAPTVNDAVMQLRYQSADLPPYGVEFINGVFHIRLIPAKTEQT
jgi:hypothetical protein